MEQFFGYLTMVLAVTMALVALPAQIMKNHREGRSNIARELAILAFGVYASRAIYGIQIESYFIVVPDTIGALFSGVLLYQIYIKPKIKILDLVKW